MIEARNLSENTRVEQTHDGSGQPDERNSSSAHTVKEQHTPEEHRGKNISVELFHQEQSCTSELFKDTQDVVSLNFHYRTM